MMQISLRCLMQIVVVMHVIVVAHVVVAVAVVVVIIIVGMVAHGVVAVVVPIMHWVGVAGRRIAVVSPHVLVCIIPRHVPGTRFEPKRVL